MGSVMKKLLFAVFLLFCSTVHAITPATGAWYNPAESGRGFIIEVQNSTLSMASYVYDSKGNQIWYTSVGTYNESSKTWSATLDSTSGGQCLGCSYTKPTSKVSAGGAVSITFSDTEHGTITYPGGSSPIQHLNYGYVSPTDYFQGEWVFSFDNAGVVTSQWVVFNTHYTATDGTVYSEGGQDGVAGTIALGTASNNTYIVAVGTSSYIYLYQFSGDQNRMLGAGQGTPSSITPTTLGYVAAGSRILTPAQLASLGPSSITPDPSYVERRAQLEAAIKAAKQSGAFADK